MEYQNINFKVCLSSFGCEELKLPKQHIVHCTVSHCSSGLYWVICTVSVHCREEGCIGKYIPRGPRDFPRAGILHPEAREISRGRSPREISRAEGCKIPARGKSQGPRGMYFPMHPDSRQCTSILSALAGKY